MKNLIYNIGSVSKVTDWALIACKGLMKGNEWDNKYPFNLNVAWVPIFSRIQVQDIKN